MNIYILTQLGIEIMFKVKKSIKFKWINAFFFKNFMAGLKGKQGRTFRVVR